MSTERIMAPENLVGRSGRAGGAKLSAELDDDRIRQRFGPPPDREGDHGLVDGGSAAIGISGRGSSGRALDLGFRTSGLTSWLSETGTCGRRLRRTPRILGCVSFAAGEGPRLAVDQPSVTGRGLKEQCTVVLHQGLSLLTLIETLS